MINIQGSGCYRRCSGKDLYLDFLTRRPILIRRTIRTGIQPLLVNRDLYRLLPVGERNTLVTCLSIRGRCAFSRITVNLNLLNVVYNRSSSVSLIFRKTRKCILLLLCSECIRLISYRISIGCQLNRYSLAVRPVGINIPVFFSIYPTLVDGYINRFFPVSDCNQRVPIRRNRRSSRFCNVTGDSYLFNVILNEISICIIFRKRSKFCTLTFNVKCSTLTAYRSSLSVSYLLGQLDLNFLTLRPVLFSTIRVQPLLVNSDLHSLFCVGDSDLSIRIRTFTGSLIACYVKFLDAIDDLGIIIRGELRKLLKRVLRL